jgi:hypothetical protein
VAVSTITRQDSRSSSGRNSSLVREERIAPSIDELKQRLLYRQAIERRVAWPKACWHGALTRTSARSSALASRPGPAVRCSSYQSEGRERFFANAQSLAQRHGARFAVAPEVRDAIERLPH